MARPVNSYIKTGACSDGRVEWSSPHGLDSRYWHGAPTKSEGKRLTVWGLDLKTFMMIDNPSASWRQRGEVSADVGFRYLARWGRVGVPVEQEPPTTRLPHSSGGGSRTVTVSFSYGCAYHHGVPLWYGQQTYWSAIKARKRLRRISLDD